MSAAGAARRRTAAAAAPVVRTRHGAPASSVTATDAKKQFGRVLEMALRGGTVVITKHDAPKAVLLSMDDFQALTGAGASALDTLSADFDAMLARMQAPRARARMKAAFGASPRALGRAAVTAARQRG